MKKCSRCQTVKPLDDFSSRSRWTFIPQSQCKACHTEVEAARRGGRTQRKPRTMDPERHRRLPVEPFRFWLAGLLYKCDGDYAVLARRLDTNQDMLRSVMTRRETVAMDFADRCFCRAGEPYLLRELYPELYEFGDAPSVEDEAA